MKLPLELREDIWFYTMCDPDQTDNSICTYTEPKFDRNVANMVYSRKKYVWCYPQYSILNVSKAVRDEAIGVLHRRFIFDVGETCSDGRGAHEVAKALSSRPGQELRSVKVVLDLELESDSIFPASLFETDAEHVRLILSDIEALVHQLKGLRCVCKLEPP